MELIQNPGYDTYMDFIRFSLYNSKKLWVFFFFVTKKQIKYKLISVSLETCILTKSVFLVNSGRHYLCKKKLGVSISNTGLGIKHSLRQTEIARITGI